LTQSSNVCAIMLALNGPHADHAAVVSKEGLGSI
jgi:hypothetical protein